MNVNYPNGFVVLPIGEYNKLKETIEAQQQAINSLVDVRPSYDKARLDVYYNEKALYELAISKLEEYPELLPSYDVVEKDSFNAWTSVLAHIKPTSEIEEG